HSRHTHTKSSSVVLLGSSRSPAHSAALPSMSKSGASCGGQSRIRAHPHTLLPASPTGPGGAGQLSSYERSRARRPLFGLFLGERVAEAEVIRGDTVGAKLLRDCAHKSGHRGPDRIREQQLVERPKPLLAATIARYAFRTQIHLLG